MPNAKLIHEYVGVIGDILDNAGAVHGENFKRGIVISVNLMQLAGLMRVYIKDKVSHAAAMALIESTMTQALNGMGITEEQGEEISKLVTSIDQQYDKITRELR
jgi:hypothetical protein